MKRAERERQQEKYDAFFHMVKPVSKINIGILPLSIYQPVMKKILCFGEVLWDAFGEEKRAGGAPMNVARHLVQQHMDVSFASRVGKDASGDELVDFLKKNGLYSNLVQTDD